MALKDRTCARCGSEFKAYDKEYCCAKCIKPKAIKNTISNRDRQIIGLVSEAKSNKEIAYVLKLSEGTVKEYLFKIFKQVGAVSRLDLMRKFFPMLACEEDTLP